MYQAPDSVTHSWRGLIPSAWLTVAALALVAMSALVFRSGLDSGFVSDAWIFLDRARHHFAAVLPWFRPDANPAFYRPGVELTFWIEYRLFGLNPIGYHLVAFGAHLASAGLLGVISWRLTKSRAGAFIASAAFLFTIAAHEVVFDVADLHNALSAPLLLAAVLAGLSGRKWLPAAIMIIGLTIDENALLVAPLCVVFASMYGQHSIRRSSPVVLVAIGYLLFRLAGGGVTSEAADHCLAASCVLQGMDKFIDRLLLRPDALIALDPGALLVLAFAMVAGLVMRTHGRHWEAMKFGIIWAVGTSAFFVLTLYPYIADRFLYVPSAGLAIAVSAVAAEAVARLDTRIWADLRAAGAVLAIVVWIAVGAQVLSDRGRAWSAAGSWAHGIVADTVRLVPNPPSQAILAFSGIPADLDPFPPGNTGPYVFHNGLRQALFIAYGRGDFTVVELADNDSRWNQPGTVGFHVTPSGVELRETGSPESVPAGPPRV